MISNSKIYYFLLIISLTFAKKYYDEKEDFNSNDSNESMEVININDSEFQDSSWDVLIFTQQWPVTACIHWKNENQDHKCDLPSEKEFWTIHGLWPTKYGKIGPSFCNRTNAFDVKKLDAIVDNLETYWPNIEEGMSYDSLWRHEWEKHGTCAAEIVHELNTELKYFTTGLQWRNQFLISTILDQSSIHPDSNNNVINIHNAMKKVLNKNSAIHCLYDREKDISYLSEIRICFDKSLKLIDCDGVVGEHISVDYPGGNLITNCHISKTVVYPSSLPNKQQKFKFNFREAFKLLNFIMWVTL